MVQVMLLMVFTVLFSILPSWACCRLIPMDRSPFESKIR